MNVCAYVCVCTVRKILFSDWLAKLISLLHFDVIKTLTFVFYLKTRLILLTLPPAHYIALENI